MKPILSAEKLFSIAHDEAMKRSVKGTSENVPLIRRARKKEATRIELLSKALRNRLFQIVEEFPNIGSDEVIDYYVEILDMSFGVDKVRKTLGSFSGSADVIWKIKREYLGDVWHAKTVIEAKHLRRTAYGRMKSVIRKLDDRLKFIEDIRAKMRNMPAFDMEQPTICISGYPNVGKSSLVNAVTAAAPEIGVYPFTTKEVIVGHFNIPVFAGSDAVKPITEIPCQIVDTPGLLDRSLEERNEIELRAVAALKTLATAIIFILDYTQNSELNQQINLLKGIKKNFVGIPILIICGKKDLLSEEQKEKLMEYWTLNIPQNEFILVSMNDQGEIVQLIQNFYKKNHQEIAKRLKEL